MTKNEPQTFEDKDYLKDALNTQKFIVGNYNTFSTECATPKVRADVMAVYNDELKIQNEIFEEMNSRGWYKVAPAEQKKVDTAKQKLNSEG